MQDLKSYLLAHLGQPHILDAVKDGGNNVHVFIKPSTRGTPATDDAKDMTPEPEPLEFVCASNNRLIQLHVPFVPQPYAPQLGCAAVHWLTGKRGWVAAIAKSTVTTVFGLTESPTNDRNDLTWYDSQLIGLLPEDPKIQIEVDEDKLADLIPLGFNHFLPNEIFNKKRYVSPEQLDAINRIVSLWGGGTVDIDVETQHQSTVDLLKAIDDLTKATQ